jgi:beta-lactamase regulating signal transducer with metallopeptidase domain
MGSYSLHLAGALLTFILKVTAGFVLCLGLARLLPSPRHRFLTWLGFLLGAGLSWIALVTDEVVALFARSASAATANFATSAGRLPGEHLLVPASWSIWMGRGAAAVGAIYLVIALTLLGREGLKHVRLHAWLSHGEKPSAELQQVFERLCRDFNIRRCRLLVLPRVSTPATVYWWTPRIVLPEVCEELVPSPQLDNILRHELIHTLRCDYLWATLGDLLCALLFFHPAVWQARKRMVIQRELACDLGVVESRPEQRADYADSLARFVRLVMLKQSPGFGVDFAASPSFLGTRIRHILTEPPRVSRWRKLFDDTAFIAFIVIFVSVSPALSISLDFSSQPRPQITSAPRPARVLPIQNKVVPHRRHYRLSVPVAYQDSLTTLPLQNRVQESLPESDLEQPENWNSQDVTPFTESNLITAVPVSFPRPTAHDVVIGEVEGAAGISRSQRHGREHEKR